MQSGLYNYVFEGEQEYCFNAFLAKVFNNEEFQAYIFQNECLQIAFLTPKGGLKKNR